MTIADLKRGQKFRVKSISIFGEIGKRLADMGFTHGTEGMVVRSALFGDPIQIELMNYNVSIRRAEAKGVEIELVGQGGGHGYRHRHGHGAGA